MKEYYLNKMKKVEICFLAWFFGMHYLYMGKIGLQFLFWFTFGGFGLWALIDLFRIKGIVEKYNLTLINRIKETE